MWTMLRSLVHPTNTTAPATAERETTAQGAYTDLTAQAEQVAKRYSDLSDSLRSRADLWGKAIGGTGMAAVGWVGLTTATDVFPIVGLKGTIAAVLAALCLADMAIMAVYVGYLFQFATRQISMQLNIQEMISSGDISAPNEADRWREADELAEDAARLAVTTALSYAARATASPAEVREALHVAERAVAAANSRLAPGPGFFCHIRWLLRSMNPTRRSVPTSASAAVLAAWSVHSACMVVVTSDPGFFRPDVTTREVADAVAKAGKRRKVARPTFRSIKRCARKATRAARRSRSWDDAERTAIRSRAENDTTAAINAAAAKLRVKPRTDQEPDQWESNTRDWKDWRKENRASKRYQRKRSEASIVADVYYRFGRRNQHARVMSTPADTVAPGTNDELPGLEERLPYARGGATYDWVEAASKTITDYSNVGVRSESRAERELGRSGPHDAMVPVWLARSAQIRAEVYATQMRAMAVVVRRRVVFMTTGWGARLAIIAFAAGLIGVSFTADWSASIRAEQTAKLDTLTHCATTVDAMTKAGIPAATISALLPAKCDQQ